MLADQEGIVPNAKRLLWAGFMAILAAGVGFAIRGGIFDNWAGAFGFTGAQLGAIGGAGFTGFCFGIIIGGVLCDKIGYGKLVLVAFAFHVLSAFVTFGATTKENAYDMLYWGMFIFAFANGALEAVANPLVATCFPKNRTHYLNILHASWPAGLVLGGVCGWFLDDAMNINWKIQLSLYLIPTVIYGILFFGQKFPKSEASEKGLSLGEMFKDVGILGGVVVCGLLSFFLAGLSIGPVTIPPMVGYGIGVALLVVLAIITKGSFGALLLFVLFLAHALVGAVELGTDGWIQNITGNILSSGQGKFLFIWTSLLMFLLRFCAHWIEKNLKLSPPALLLVCSIFAVVGLQLASMMTGFAMAVAALTVYAIGKTFFWPTMLAVASDRFPRTGAVAISIMGGIGMLSAGILGSPGLGYAKDRFTGEALNAANPAAYAEYKAEKPSKFLPFIFGEAYGLDGTKLSEAQKAVEKTENQKAAAAASIAGDRATLKADSFIPAMMGVIFLGIVLYFKTRGGYKPVHIDGSEIH